jgi:hypothetical protein
MTNRRRNDGRRMPDRNAALKGEEWRLKRGFVVGSFRLNAFGGG